MNQKNPMIQCPNHQDSQISLVNLGLNVPKCERLYCSDGCQWNTVPKSLKLFLNDWNDKSERIKTNIQKQQQQYWKCSRFISKNIIALREEIYNRLTHLIEEFEDQTNQDIAKYEKILLEFDHIPNEQITRNRLIQMIEIFLKPENELQKIQVQSVLERQKKMYASVEEILATSSINLKEELQFEYELIDQLYSQTIRTIAFNSSGEIVVVGCEEKIKIYDFNHGNLEEKATLEGHTGLVVSLCYSKFRNYFISGGKNHGKINDSTLRVWEKTTENQWQNKGILSNHSHSIQQILLDQQEKQMITCDDGNNILIWENDNGKWNHLQTLLDHGEYVYSISLNKANTFLASTSYDQTVKIWMKQQDNQWKLFQSLNFEEYGYRIIFLNDQSFIWQCFKSGTLKLFQLKEQIFQETSQTLLSEGTKCYWRFPSIFNEKLGIIVTKHNKSIYILKVKEHDGNLNLTNIQEIPFKSYYIYGQLSPNGNYLIAYDENSVKIQVYKMQFKVV